MSSNVGLSTPRGSGTSGYVQKNAAFLRPRTQPSGTPYSEERAQHAMRREPNKEILDHERKREVEVKCFELRDKLEEEGKLSDDEIEEQVDALRKKLLLELEQNVSRVGAGGKRLKEWETHEIAARKIQENERFERAIGLKRDGGGGGGNMGPPPARRQWDRGVERGGAGDGERRRSRSPDDAGDRERRRSRSPSDERRRRFSDDGGKDRSRDRYERRDKPRSRDRDRSGERDRRTYYDRDDARNHREQREREERAREREIERSP